MRKSAPLILRNSVRKISKRFDIFLTEFHARISLRNCQREIKMCSHQWENTISHEKFSEKFIFPLVRTRLKKVDSQRTNKLDIKIIANIHCKNKRKW